MLIFHIRTLVFAPIEGVKDFWILMLRGMSIQFFLDHHHVVSLLSIDNFAFVEGYDLRNIKVAETTLRRIKAHKRPLHLEINIEIASISRSRICRCSPIHRWRARYANIVALILFLALQPKIMYLTFYLHLETSISI